MRVFITGASGFIGAAIVQDLLRAGHQVTGLVRSQDAAARLQSLGATACRGSIEDLDLLRRAASEAEGVIHTAFFHAFSNAGLGTRLRVLFGGSPSGIVQRFMGAAVDAEVRAIEACGAGLRGSERALTIALPTMTMTPGRLALERDVFDPKAVGGLRGRSEQAALALTARGVRATIVRLPPAVHDERKFGAVNELIAIARKKGMSAYVGDGANRWGAVHRLDAARLFRLALEQGKAGARYHAVAEEGMPFRAIAQEIGQRLGVETVALAPSEAARHFGWLAPFAATDNPVSSQATREAMDWRPGHAQLLADLRAQEAGAGRVARA